MHGKFGLLSTGKASSHSTALPSFVGFFGSVIHRTLTWTTGSVTCVRSYAYVYTRGWGTPTTSQHNTLTRKNSHNLFLCSGRDSNLWSWNPSDLEADALPIELPSPPTWYVLLAAHGHAHRKQDTSTWHRHAHRDIDTPTVAWAHSPSHGHAHRDIDTPTVAWTCPPSHGHAHRDMDTPTVTWARSP